MRFDRRSFLRASTGLAAASAAGLPAAAAQTESGEPLPEPIRALKPMTGGIAPITDRERLERIEKARKLMTDNGIDAIFIEPGSSLFYYTGVRWSNSERMFGFVLPRQGEPAYICPQFEEARARELTKFSNDIRAWEEDESPYKLVAQILKDRGAATGTIGMEERVRFFLFEGIRKEMPGATYVSADPVTVGCRVHKSESEIALMQRASDITIAAFRATFQTLHEGMTQFRFRDYVRAAFRACGASGGALVQFGEYTAYPHGSITPQKIKEGDVVLVDGGCGVDGYRSDITRTTVFGKPSKRQTEVWNLEKKAQTAAFHAAKVGVPCEDVDAAARKVITDAGFGPDYKVPGLPHRTGHGIGLDGHEWVNFVRGNKTPLAPGMCFSNEPMIAIYGEFGIRLEDCLYMTQDEARFFSQQSPAIDKPFA